MGKVEGVEAGVEGAGVIITVPEDRVWLLSDSKHTL
jgi:hypothetical protein